MKKQKNSLILTHPEGMTVGLFDSPSPSGEEVPGKKIKGAVLYEDLPAGAYRYVAEGSGFYGADQMIFFSEKEKAKGKIVSVIAIPRGGRGYEPTDPVRYLAAGVLEKIAPSGEKDFSEYGEVLQTPSFSSHLAAHETAHQEDVEAYLEKETARTPDAYFFSAGKSGKYGYEIPMILLTETDLSAAKTVFAAARLMKKNGKVKIYYQAQIHGNEPAACEGALASLHALCGEWGKKILKTADLIVLPRLNPDGARDCTRNESARKANLNRDMFSAVCAETKASHRVIRYFQPEVVIDAHEYTSKNELSEAAYNDILMSTGGGINNGPGVRGLGVRMMRRAMDRLGENSIRAFAYNNVDTPKKGAAANSINPATGRLFHGLGGALSFLVESRGIRMGKNCYRRRTVSQYLACTDLIDFAASHAQEVKRTVSEEREELSRRGSAYSEKNLFVLRGETSQLPGHSFTLAQPRYDYYTGRLTDPAARVRVYFIDEALQSRPLPLAYWVPKGEKWEKRVREQLSVLGISFTEEAPGASRSLLQYSGTQEEIALLPEKEVSFPKGAICVPMAQTNMLYAAYLFEPDIGDAREGAVSLVQTGVIGAENGVFPIYRQIH